MDKNMARLVHEELIAASKAIFAKHGFKHNGGSFRYDSGFTFTIKAESTATEHVTEQNKVGAALVGLPESVLHQKLTYLGKEYRIEGFLPNRAKNNVSIKREPDGKGFVISADLVRKCLNLPAE